MSKQRAQPSGGSSRRSASRTDQSAQPSQQVSIKQARHERRREEQRRREQERLRARRNRRLLAGGVLVLFIALLAGGVYLFTHAQAQGSTVVDSAYPPVDGVSCDAAEQVAVHYHAHVSIYINGKAVLLPTNTGIAPDCFYWLHTHDSSGVVHIEAPRNLKFTLGQFLQVWQQKFADLSNGFPTELDQTSGWTVYVNGQPYHGDFHAIVLQAHELITLAYNSPGVQPDTTYNWGEL